MAREPLGHQREHLPWVVVGVAVLTVLVLGLSHRRAEKAQRTEIRAVTASVPPTGLAGAGLEGSPPDVTIEGVQPSRDGPDAGDPTASRAFMHNLGIGGNGVGAPRRQPRPGAPSVSVVTASHSETTEEAVARGLEWLADHQSADGGWDTDGFEKECARAVGERDGAHAACGGAGEYEWADPGLTGLCLLAFLGTGNTHRSGPYQDCVEKALRYLQRIQTPEGCFGAKDGQYMYNHAIAALSMADAYAVSGRSPLIRAPAQKGIDFLARAQNPGRAWRYTSQSGDNDTSVTGWAVMALRSAELGGLSLPRQCFTGARAWIDEVTDTTWYQVGYRARPDPGARICRIGDKFDTTEAMTAIGMISRLALGARPSDPAQSGGAELLIDQLPEWSDPKGTIDMYYWYLGTLAMFQIGGEHWHEWNEAMKSALVGSQRYQGGSSGSWDSIGRWGAPGGRVYATAINVLTLQVEHR